ncbi:MAG: hypothetical protein ACK5KT_00105 [Dysgonomonas sp.]
MKRYKSKLFTAILLVFALLSFSSCEKEARWIATTLDFEVEVPTRSDGYFEYTIRVYDIDIADYRPEREDLIDIRTLNAWVTLSNIERTHRINLRIVANGNIIYDYLPTISPNVNNEYVINDNAYVDIMADVIYVIRRRGYVYITITGTSNIRDGYTIVFTFKNNIYIYVSD